MSQFASLVDPARRIVSHNMPSRHMIAEIEHHREKPDCHVCKTLEDSIMACAAIGRCMMGSLRTATYRFVEDGKPLPPLWP